MCDLSAALSQRAYELLRTGHTARRDYDPYQAAFSLAVSFHRSGLSLSDYFSAVLNPSNLGGGYFIEIAQPFPLDGAMHFRHRKRAFRRAEKLWAKAARYVESGGDQHNVDDASLACALEHAFQSVLSAIPKATAIPERLLLAAHAQLAWRTLSVSYTASTRQLAETAGLSRRKIFALHSSLQEANHLRLLLSGSKESASSWLLLCPHDDPLSGFHLMGNFPHEEQLAQIERLLSGLGHDAFYPGGLTKLDLWTWAMLPDDGASFASLLDSTGCPRRSLYGALRRLRTSGLVSGPSSAVVPLREDLDAIALINGTAGAAKRARAVHDSERDEWNDHRLDYGNRKNIEVRQVEQILINRLQRKGQHQNDQL